MPDSDADGDPVDETTRKRLLGKLDRPSGTVGAEMPDRLTVQGTTVDLRRFVMECSDLETVPDAERERIESLLSGLRRERLARKQRLERDPITEAEGEQLVSEVRGIDRAINALESLDDPGLEEQVRRKQLADARELLSLVRQME